MEKEVFKPKMRVTLLSDNGTPTSDRLVDSYTELNNGPKESHYGPVRIEVTLSNNQDVENFKQYLDRLSGKLPIRTYGSRRGRPSMASQEIEEPREEILSDIQKMIEEGKNQKDIIKYLRGLGFIFMLTEDFLQYFPQFPFNVKDVHNPNENGQYLDSLSWMVRQIKKAKVPKSDKYDPQLIFGFSIINGPSNKVVPYMYKERKKPLRVKPAKKTLSFSNVGFTKYPTYMREDERLKFSTEIRQLLNGIRKKPSTFFNRWVKDVKFPDNLQEKLQAILDNKEDSDDEKN
ncbi:MAG: hypothetical protein NC131_06070 [Roseburia sp.]|nr:hypothetical protein [Roseburia sp.]